MRLSIRNMNYTLARREQDGSMVSSPKNREKSHYWWIERWSKARKQWLYVRDFMGSKSEAAELFTKKYRHNKLSKFRLRHRFTY